MRLRSVLATLVVLGAALSVGTARNSLAALQRSSQHGQTTLETTADGALAHALSLRLCCNAAPARMALGSDDAPTAASGAVYVIEGTKNGVFTFVARCQRLRQRALWAVPQCSGLHGPLLTRASRPSSAPPAPASLPTQRAAQERVRPGTPGAQPEYPGSPPPHVHERQEETFVVLAGTMGYMLDGKHGTVATGESATIPRGALRAGLERAEWRFRRSRC